MISLWRIFWLEVVALVRSWTALMLLVASLGWMFAANFVLVTDATEEGKREMLVLYGLGGVFVLLIIAVLASHIHIVSDKEIIIEYIRYIPLEHRFHGFGRIIVVCESLDVFHRCGDHGRELFQNGRIRCGIFLTHGIFFLILR